MAPSDCCDLLLSASSQPTESDWISIKYMLNSVLSIDRVYSCVRILEAHIGRVGPYWAAHVGHVHLLVLQVTLAI